MVASRDGGLPETDCGALVLVEPDDAEALAQGILAARRLGPVLRRERMDAGRDFTVADSVTSLLDVLEGVSGPTPSEVIHALEELVALPSASEPHIRPGVAPPGARTATARAALPVRAVRPS